MPILVHPPLAPHPKLGISRFSASSSLPPAAKALLPPSPEFWGAQHPPKSTGVHSRRGWRGLGGLLAALGPSPWGESLPLGRDLEGKKRGEGGTPNRCCSPDITGHSGWFGAARRARHRPEAAPSVRPSLPPAIPGSPPPNPPAVRGKTPGKRRKAAMPTWGSSGAGGAGSRGSPGAPHAPRSHPSPSAAPGPARAHRPRPRHVTAGRARGAGPARALRCPLAGDNTPLLLLGSRAACPRPPARGTPGVVVLKLQRARGSG